MAIKPAIANYGNNNCLNLHWLNGDKNIIHLTPKVGKKTFKIMFNIQFGQITKFKIIYNSIPHKPSKVGVMVRIIFSLTLDEAMSAGLAKACALRKIIYSVIEKSIALLNIQTE